MRRCPCHASVENVIEGRHIFLAGFIGAEERAGDGCSAGDTALVRQEMRIDALMLMFK